MLSESCHYTSNVVIVIAYCNKVPNMMGNDVISLLWPFLACLGKYQIVWIQIGRVSTKM